MVKIWISQVTALYYMEKFTLKFPPQLREWRKQIANQR